MKLEEAKKILTANGFTLFMQGSAVKGRIGLTPKDLSSDRVIEAHTTCVEAGYIPTKAYKNGPFKPILNKEAVKEFNDFLLDAQKKKIDDLLKVIESRNNDIERLSNKVSRLKKVIGKKNAEIRKKSHGCVNVFNENVELKQTISDKDAVLGDVAEELRLSKVREDNLTELSQKYLKEIDELKKDLAESEKHKNKAYKSLAEKNEEIEMLKGATNILQESNGHLIDKLKHNKDCKGNPLCKDIARRKSAEAVADYVDDVVRAELDGLVLEVWENDGKKITAVYQCNNGKRIKLCLDFTGDEIKFSRSDPDKMDSLEEEILANFKKENKIMEDFLFNAGYMGGNGILDQMEVAVDKGKGKPCTSRTIIDVRNIMDD